MSQRLLATVHTFVLYICELMTSDGWIYNKEKGRLRGRRLLLPLEEGPVRRCSGRTQHKTPSLLASRPPPTSSHLCYPFLSLNNKLPLSPNLYIHHPGLHLYLFITCTAPVNPTNS